MSDKCVFCKIVRGEEDTKILFQDDAVVIFQDIKPAATHHYLVIPKEHIKDGKALTVDHKDLVEKLVSEGKRFLQSNGADLNDVRMGFHWPPFNSIPHLHLHLISPQSEMGFIARTIFKPDSYWFLTPEYVLQHKLQPKL